MISFDCYKPSSLSQYHKSFIVGFLVNNTTNERIFIEWENARINNSRICYGDESMLSMDMPKADEAVSANSLSIKRDITATKNVSIDSIIHRNRTFNSGTRGGKDPSTFIEITEKEYLEVSGLTKDELLEIVKNTKLFIPTREIKND